MGDQPSLVGRALLRVRPMKEIAAVMHLHVFSRNGFRESRPGVGPQKSSLQEAEEHPLNLHFRMTRALFDEVEEADRKRPIASE
jgi:hypothetical protein